MTPSETAYLTQLYVITLWSFCSDWSQGAVKNNRHMNIAIDVGQLLTGDIQVFLEFIQMLMEEGSNCIQYI